MYKNGVCMIYILVFIFSLTISPVCLLAAMGYSSDGSNCQSPHRDLGAVISSVMDPKFSSPNRKVLSDLSARLNGVDPKFASPGSHEMIVRSVQSMQETPERSQELLARKLTKSYKSSLENSPTIDSRIKDKPVSSDITEKLTENNKRLKYARYKNSETKKRRIGVVDSLVPFVPRHEIATVATKHVACPEIKRNATGEVTSVVGGHDLGGYNSADIAGPCLKTLDVTALLVGKKKLKTVEADFTEEKVLDVYHSSVPLSLKSPQNKELRVSPDGKVYSVFYDDKTPLHAKTLVPIFSIGEDVVSQGVIHRGSLNVDGSFGLSDKISFDDELFENCLMAGELYSPAPGQDIVAVDITEPFHTHLSCLGADIKDEKGGSVKVPMVATVSIGSPHVKLVKRTKNHF